MLQLYAFLRTALSPHFSMHMIEYLGFFLFSGLADARLINNFCYHAKSCVDILKFMLSGSQELKLNLV